MRPQNDITPRQEIDPYETIQFLRHSNEQWQATAERVARQRDEAYDLLYRIVNVLDDSNQVEEETYYDLLDAIRDIVRT